MEFPPNVACISCGARCDEQGGVNTALSTPGEPICMNCTVAAQGKMQRMHCYVAIDGERAYQDRKHGNDKHSLVEWLTIIEGLVNRAKERFQAGGPSTDFDILNQMRKIAATGVACMEQHGAVGREDERPKCDICGDTAEEHRTQTGYDHEFGGIADIPARKEVGVIMQSDLRKSIEQSLNCFSAENGSNTPDFILAQYLMDCLGAYDKAVTAREKWYGREPKPLDPQPLPPPDPVGKPFLTSI